jgi:hypothetical protein
MMLVRHEKYGIEPQDTNVAARGREHGFHVLGLAIAKDTHSRHRICLDPETGPAAEMLEYCRQSQHTPVYRT